MLPGICGEEVRIIGTNRQTVIKVRLRTELGTDLTQGGVCSRMYPVKPAHDAFRPLYRAGNQ